MFVLIIFGILRYFELKMIVLGGVVIGSINVQEVVRVVFIISMQGCMLMAMARGVSMGRSMVVVARLEVILVRKLIVVIRISSSRKSGSFLSKDNCFLIYFVSFVVLNFFVSVSFLLNSSNMFYGSLMVFFYFIKGCL